MATSFDAVYYDFLSKVQDPTFFELPVTTRESLLEGFLNTAQAKFQRVCKVDLTDRDNMLKLYNNDLDNEIIDILGTGMVWAWLCYKLNYSDLLENFLSTKDYTLAAAPSNMLREVRATRDTALKDFSRDITMYSYAVGNIAEMTDE